jgi:hypothetical protein
MAQTKHMLSCANLVDLVEYAAKTHGLRTFVHGERNAGGMEFWEALVNALQIEGASVMHLWQVASVCWTWSPMAVGIPAKSKP